MMQLFWVYFFLYRLIPDPSVSLGCSGGPSACEGCSFFMALSLQNEHCDIVVSANPTV
jgi:hypothetical protein